MLMCLMLIFYLPFNDLMQFWSDGGLILFSKVLMPDNSYTYISDAWHCTSTVQWQ